MPIGPSLPPHLAHLSSRSSRSPSPESETDDFGPALPPHLAAARNVAGPSRPPALPSPPPQATYPVYEDEDDDDDDDIGPRPVASGMQERSAVQEFMEREARWAKEREAAKKPKKLEREEWMLVPPTSGVLSTGMLCSWIWVAGHCVDEDQLTHFGNGQLHFLGIPQPLKPTPVYGQRRLRRKHRE
jgi:hypothetical protein